MLLGPDSDGDGIPDEWERWTHSDRFFDDSALDLDGDGWDDDYARYYMPAAPTDNFDVEVNIYSSRSAYLSLSDNDNRLKGMDV